MPETRDKFNELAATCKLTVAILGNPETQDFELHDLADCPTAFRFGLQFLGCFGVAEGPRGLEGRAALNVELPYETVDLLARLFVEHVARKLSPGSAKVEFQN